MGDIEATSEAPATNPGTKGSSGARIRKLACVNGDGGFHRVRKTGASHLERDRPGAAKAYLGHLTPGMERHYIDRRIAGSDPPIPPAWD